MALSKMNASPIKDEAAGVGESGAEGRIPIMILKRPPQAPAFQNMNEQRWRNLVENQRHPDDMDEALFESECEKFLKSLQLSSAELETGEQSEVGALELESRTRLTSSNFGRVIKLLNTTYRRPLVEELLGLISKTDSPYWIRVMEYERNNQRNAIIAYEKLKNETITRCGMFVHRRFAYLAALPQGLVGNDGLVEVRCPYAARRMHPLAIPLHLKSFYCTTDGRNTQLYLRSNHDYYYEIQGQLEITDRRFCDFVVWTSRGIHVERIERDRTVWERVCPKLVDFYKQSMLPEIVDSRYARGLPLREPDFVLKAIEKEQKTKNVKGK